MEPQRQTRFEETVMAHFDAAYNLARWLARDEHDAEDVVQEACLRAYRFFGSFHGGNARAWLLAIVRNTYYTWLEKNRAQTLNVQYNEDTVAAVDYDMATTGDSVERLLHAEDTRRCVHRALEQIPAEFREVIVLRELEDLSYREIAEIADIPLGTVMSRLSRARKLLLHALQELDQES
ncbi:MAG TPA: sigma-70 family RNA polymerase sigma factor [Accumulibacter sp.]|nr:sigma-70 family RNA polymerase sigma factor [Accumulibacter sp.]